MTVELTPFDPTPFLTNSVQIAAYLEDALASGSAEVFADALEDVARAKAGTGLSDTHGARDTRGPAAENAGSRFDDVVHLLKQVGVSVHFAPAAYET